MSMPDPLEAIRSAAQREQEVRQTVREASEAVKAKRDAEQSQQVEEASQNGSK